MSRHLKQDRDVQGNLRGAVLNIDKVYALLENLNVSGYYIAKESGITEATLSNYRNGVTRVEKLSLEKAARLIQIYDELVEDGVI